MSTLQQNGSKEATGGKPGYWRISIFVGTLILIICGGLVFFINKPIWMTSATEITVYKSPTCNCCNKWIVHLEDAGFNVIAKNNHDMHRIKQSSGIAPPLQSCHTALVEGYVIEGHVPASDIKRLLQERPAVSGLTVPGMPVGSPGMEGPYKEPYEVLTFNKDGQTTVYARY